MVAIGRTFLPRSLKTALVLSSISCLSVDGKGDLGATVVRDPFTFLVNREIEKGILVPPSFSPH